MAFCSILFFPKCTHKILRVAHFPIILALSTRTVKKPNETLIHLTSCTKDCFTPHFPYTLLQFESSDKFPLHFTNSQNVDSFYSNSRHWISAHNLMNPQSGSYTITRFQHRILYRFRKTKLHKYMLWNLGGYSTLSNRLQTLVRTSRSSANKCKKHAI